MAGSDMMMILVVGAIALGGFFLLQSSGGLAGLTGGGAEQAPAAPAPTEGEEQEQEGEGQEDGMGMGQGQPGMGGPMGYPGMGGPGMSYPYPVAQPYPVPVPVGGPYRPPFGRRPWGPRIPLRPGPLRPCFHVCTSGNPAECLACRKAHGNYRGLGPYKYHPANIGAIRAKKVYRAGSSCGCGG